MGNVSEIENPGQVTKAIGQGGVEQGVPILERDVLHATDVLAVAEGRALAVVVQNYYSKAACEEMAARLLGAPWLWTTYPAGSGAEHIGTSGGALFNCVGDELSPDCEEYFAKAPDRNRALREVLAPWIHPADRVRIQMDNEWPAGASLLRVNGRPAFYGLCRLVRAGGGIEPHTDRADWDLTCKETEVFRTQLFVNVYLSQAEHGGDLELWDMEVPEKSDYDALRSKTTSYALDRDLLPEPTATVSIEPGALLIAAASKPHAVTPCAGAGQRLSVSGFIGYSGTQAPLLAFS
jgi:hypothetical protein